MNSNNNVDQLQQATPRSNAKWLPTPNEAVILPEAAITPKRTPEEQEQRDQLLNAVKAVKNWSTMLTFYTEHENWAEVEFLLKLSDRTCEMLHEAFAHFNNKDGN